MRIRASLAALAVVLLAGCGSAGGGSVSGDASSLIPADALAFVTIDTDLGSSQMTSAQSILDKFPIKQQLLGSLRSGVAQSGMNLASLESSVGPELDLAVVKLDSGPAVVGFTKPADEKQFDAQLESGQNKAVHTTISGWTVFSDSQPALDAIKKRSGDLADTALYKDGIATLPAAGDAIVRAVIAPAAITQAVSSSGVAVPIPVTTGNAKWVALALTSAKSAFKLEVHAKGVGGAVKARADSLASQIPSGSILAFSFDGGSSAVPASTQEQLSKASQQLGIDLKSLLGALDGPVIGYVRAGLPLPDITIAAKPADPQAAVAAIGGLIKRLSGGQMAPTPTKVDGGTLNKVALGPIDLYYGMFGDELVVSDSANAIAELKGGQGKLSDDAVFKEARDASGMPDGSQGWLFANLKDAVPAAASFANLANTTIPPNIAENLKPLRSLLLFGTHEGDVQTIVTYLQTS